MRFSTIPTSLTIPVQARQNGGSVVYRGITENATATELFIDNQNHRRLVPDPRSGGFLSIRAVAYNVTDNTTLAALTNVLFQVSSAGVITLVDQDSVTGGAQDNVLSSVTTAGTRAGALGVSVAADNGVAVDVVAASGSTPAFLRLRVRGAANKTISWEVVADYAESTSTNG